LQGGGHRIDTTAVTAGILLIVVIALIPIIAVPRPFASITITSIKDYFQAIQALVTTVGILVGGYWAYEKFVLKREEFPAAKITHQITYVPITDEKSLLRVTINISNQGGVLLKVSAGEMWIQQVLPCHPELLEKISQGEDLPRIRSKIAWPLLPGGEQEFDIEQ
jgi:hypothetical protein